MVTIANRQEARRAERRSANAPSTLRAHSGGPVDTFVHDVSQTGARIESEAELILGDFVSIGLTGVGAVRAIVVWKREHQYGLDFIVPLTADDAARAFAKGTVVGLIPTRSIAPEAQPEAEGEAEAGVYAEATGWLSALLVVVAGGTALGVAVLQGWIF